MVKSDDNAGVASDSGRSTMTGDNSKPLTGNNGPHREPDPESHLERVHHRPAPPPARLIRSTRTAAPTTGWRSSPTPGTWRSWLLHGQRDQQVDHRSWVLPRVRDGPPRRPTPQRSSGCTTRPKPSPSAPTPAVDGRHHASLDANGFSVGNSTSVNTNAATYHYVAWNRTSTNGATSYTGTGASHTVTGVGFQPAFVMVHANDTTTGRAGAMRSSAMSGTASQLFTATANESAGITALQSDGFQVGTSATVDNGGATSMTTLPSRTSREPAPFQDLRRGGCRRSGFACGRRPGDSRLEVGARRRFAPAEPRVQAAAPDADADAQGTHQDAQREARPGGQGDDTG